MSHLYDVSQWVPAFCGYEFLGAHPPHYFGPIAGFAFSLQLATDSVYHPIGKQAEEKVRIAPVIGLMVYRTEVQVGLQLPVGTFDFSYEIVIVPRGTLVEGLYIGP